MRLRLDAVVITVGPSLEAAIALSLLSSSLKNDTRIECSTSAAPSSSVGHGEEEEIKREGPTKKKVAHYALTPASLEEKKSRHSVLRSRN